jgi:transposase-like protein
VADFRRNRWPDCVGISGRFASDYAIRRRTRVVGSFPDGQSALNLAAARLRHIAGTAWSTKGYLNIELLKDQQMRGAITA